MSVPKGMVERQPIELPVILQSEHNIPGQVVTGTVLRNKGDGWVENTWANRQLSGSIIQMRRRNGHYYHEFVPVDNALVQGDQVHLQMQAEIERLAGWYDQTGERQDGEVDQLRRNHKLLSDWLTLTQADKDDISWDFANMADVRAGARNPFNLTVGSIADRARGLKDRTGRQNPGAIRAMMLRMHKDLAGRHEEVAGNILVNHSRGNRLHHEWLFHENEILAQCHNIMERLLVSQSDSDLFALRGMAPHVRFRVKPFNLMAHEIASNGGEISDEQVVVNALAALQFERFKNYLLSPFRRVTAEPKKRPPSYVKPDDEPLDLALQRRLIALESMDAPGATGRLVSRLIRLGEAVIRAKELGDNEQAKKIGKAFKWLVNYHCLPEADLETEVWHQHQLR
ncbi:MAG: hypothetical protein V4702_03355 [Patescibacteria group bacterium]